VPNRTVKKAAPVRKVAPVKKAAPKKAMPARKAAPKKEGSGILILLTRLVTRPAFIGVVQGQGLSHSPTAE